MKLKYFYIVFLFLGNFLFINSQNAKLLIKFPTRERPEKFFRVLNLYYKNLSGKIACHFLVSCDLDDVSMNNITIINKLKKYTNLSFYFGKRVNKVEAVNRDIEKHPDFDVLLVASDDMIPIVKSYDEIIISNMQKYFPDFDGVLHFNDGRVAKKLNTLPIIGKKYYDRFNYVYYPEYQSIFCDVEMTLVSQILAKQVYLDQVIIRHDHPTFGFKHDKLSIKNESKDYHTFDFDVLVKRKALVFNLNKAELKGLKIYSSLDIFGDDKSYVKWSIILLNEESKKEEFVSLYKKLLKEAHENGLANKVEILFSCNDSLLQEENKKLLIDNAKGSFYSFIDHQDNKIINNIKVIYNKIMRTIKPLELNILGVYKKACLK